MKYKVVSFYKYIDVENPESLMEQLRTFCETHRINGRILLGQEGINGAVSADEKTVEMFKIWLNKNSLFDDVTFREQDVQYPAYHKLVIRIREEIVAFGKRVSLENKGSYIEPKELKQLIDRKEDVILVDVRNGYEAAIGKFKHAKVLPIKNFREFPDEVKNLEKLRDKKIVTYCTGGIRCEKASALLKEQGFKDVKQLHGGIINYVNQFPNTHFEGNCFVFDDRIVARISSDNGMGSCMLCKKACDTYMNCHNLTCDQLFICCESCQEKFGRTCSQDCMQSPRQRIEVKQNA